MRSVMTAINPAIINCEEERHMKPIPEKYFHFNIFGYKMLLYFKNKFPPRWNTKILWGYIIRIMNILWPNLLTV